MLEDEGFGGLQFGEDGGDAVFFDALLGGEFESIVAWGAAHGPSLGERTGVGVADDF